MWLLIQMIKILHVITGLSTGGAENMLLKLISSTTVTSNIKIVGVVSLLDKGTIGPKIEALGVPVFELNMKRGLPAPWHLVKLAKIIHKSNTDVIQSWMYHANLAATLAAAMIGKNCVIWNIRHCLHDYKNEKFLTRLMIKLGSILSRYPKKIIFNSSVSLSKHVEVGYRENQSLVIPNGFDVSLFRKYQNNSIFSQLNLPDSVIIVAIFGRYDVIKDHKNFFIAMSQVLVHTNNVIALAVGNGVDNENRAIVSQIEELGISDRVYLIGERQDVCKIMSACTIIVNSSKSEAFPNVIGEAMACEVTCVVTNVGDSSILLEENGKVVPPNDSTALANAILSLLELTIEERSKIGSCARKRIVENYSIDKISECYCNLYNSIAG